MSVLLLYFMAKVLLEPAQDEIVMNLRTSAIFIDTASILIGTDFERLVRNAGINTLIFAGIATDLAIESNARESLNRDFYTPQTRYHPSIVSFM